MVTSLEVVLIALISLTSVLAQTTCNITNPCPISTPCCSEYGFCGTGTYCLGGCNPMFSNTIDSCKPLPVCQDATHTFADSSRILTNSSYYDGNASAYDWILDQGNILTTPAAELGLTLTESNGGTRLSSTRFIHYGTISATLKAGRWNGVVAAFITMSNIKDEMDWEFPGDKVTEGQTNFFWQGVIPQTTAGATTGNLTDNYANYHTYTIDWQPTSMTFSVDGSVVRTINKADYVQNGTSRFPDTPSRIQLSLWPAGIAGVANGTVEWAGGMIDWTDPDYVSAGHFYMLVQNVTIKCGDSPPSNATSYVYGANTTAFTPSIAFSNASTMLNGASSMYSIPGPRGLGLISALVIASTLVVHIL